MLIGLFVFCSAFSLNVPISLLCALFAACNCAHRGSVAEHWSQATVMVMITRATQAKAALPSNLGDPPWLPVSGL